MTSIFQSESHILLPSSASISINSFLHSNDLKVNPDYPEPLYYGQFERTDEIDKRIYDRTLTTNTPLRPNFDPRPVETRHFVFPISPYVSKEVLNRPPAPIRNYLEYDTTKVFSSIQANAPVEGYLRNINTESSLRNQFFGLQHGAINATYIPSSNSDLYKANVAGSSLDGYEQPFPRLFQKETYHTRQNDTIANSTVGKGVFNNATKQQLRGL
jgi:hypothetical protein